jgi:hypothetical protein
LLGLPGGRIGGIVARHGRYLSNSRAARRALVSHADDDARESWGMRLA